MFVILISLSLLFIFSSSMNFRHVGGLCQVQTFGFWVPVLFFLASYYRPDTDSPFRRHCVVFIEECECNKLGALSNRVELREFVCSSSQKPRNMCRVGLSVAVRMECPVGLLIVFRRNSVIFLTHILGISHHHISFQTAFQRLVLFLSSCCRIT
jgi:hypothetical protein